MAKARREVCVCVCVWGAKREGLEMKEEIEVKKILKRDGNNY